MSHNEKRRKGIWVALALSVKWKMMTMLMTIVTEFAALFLRMASLNAMMPVIKMRDAAAALLAASQVIVLMVMIVFSPLARLHERLDCISCNVRVNNKVFTPLLY